MPTIIDDAQGARLVRVTDRMNVATVSTSTPSVAVSSPGAQGPRGEPGGNAESRTASTALGGHRVVRSTGAGAVGYADSTNAAHGDDTVGITLGAANLGDPIQVQRTGSVVEPSWNWTPLAPVFYGAAGVLTQIPPSLENGDAFIQIIGHAESATTLFVAIESPIYF